MENRSAESWCDESSANAGRVDDHTDMAYDVVQIDGANQSSIKSSSLDYMVINNPAHEDWTAATSQNAPEHPGAGLDNGMICHML